MNNEDGYQHCKFCDGNSVVIEFVTRSDGKTKSNDVRYTCLDCGKRWYKGEAKDE